MIKSIIIIEYITSLIVFVFISSKFIFINSYLIIKLNMEPFRNKLVKIINEARIDPKISSEQLYQTLSPYYNDNELHFFNKHIDTFEGINAL
jgi:hypothetical protein